MPTASANDILQFSTTKESAQINKQNSTQAAHKKLLTTNQACDDAHSEFFFRWNRIEYA